MTAAFRGISVLVNEDRETEYEYAELMEREVWDGEHTEEFGRYVSQWPDFHGDLLHYVRTNPDDAKLGRHLRLLVEGWVENFAEKLTEER